MPIAAYTGTFDPITNGHTDLIKRAAGLFDRLVIAIGVHPAKKTLFTADERVAMARQVLTGMDNVEVTTYSGLTVDFASENGIDVLVRGLRSVKDFEYEFQMDYMNHHMRSDVNTIYLAPAQEYLHVSSTLVREIAGHGGDITAWVHADIATALRGKIGA